MAHVTNDIDLSEIDDIDLLDECDRRVLLHKTAILQNIYDAKKAGRDYEKLLNDLLYQVLGRIV